MEKILKILFVEDVLRDAALIWRELKKIKIPYSKILVDNREDYIKSLETFKPDIILSDYKLPQFDGMTALLLRNELSPLTPFILVTGSINEVVAVECMKAGADDYILKDNLSRLGTSVINSLNKIELLKLKKEAETAFHESEERFRILYNDALVGLYRTNLKGEIVLANKTLVKMLGYQSFEELAAINLKETSYGSSYTRQNFIDQIEKEGEVKDLETTWICRDGSEIFIRESARAIYGADREILYYDGTVQNITEQKLAAEALNKVQHLFETLALVSPVGIFRTDLDGCTTYINPRYSELTGLSSEEAMGRGWFNAVHPDDKERIKESWSENLKSHKVSSSEYRFIRPDGTIVWVIGNAIPEWIDEEIIGYIGTITDITERNLVQEALIKSELRFKQISEYSGEWIWEVDKNGLYTYSSQIVEEILGYKPEEIVNKKYFHDFFNPAVKEQLKQEALDVFSRKESIRDFENSSLHKDGREVILSTSCLPVMDSSGNLISYLGVDRDVTERKRAEEELKQSYAFNESLLKTIPFGMNIVDETGTVLFHSENLKRLFGEEAIGKKCWELYRDDKKQCSDCPLVKGITIGETEAYESHGILGNRIFEIMHTGMFYQGKKAMLEIFQDITDRKVNEAELISSKEKAEESDRLKTAFLHNISHEIRTPMNAIVGFSALLGESEVDAQTRKSYIEMIMQSSDHLLAIITDIVDISNIEANLVKTVKNERNLNSLLKSLCNQFMPKANEKKIQLICEPGLSDSEAYIRTDNTKLTQILSNLISNALKFTDKGNIKVGYKVKDGFLEFSVSDTGIGIPDEYQEKIFDRFYQVANTVSRIYEGTGLGLAISKGYVELLGGRIWLESKQGPGATFYFTIPYERSISASEAAFEKPIAEKQVFKTKKTILVAEDIESNFKLLKYFLSDQNIVVLRAENGKEAVEQCLSGAHIDLILMDIKMPVMDGYTAVKLIREAKITIPIIAQTAYADDRNKVIEAGFSGFISKPFDRKNLFKVLAEFI